jgi:glycosyltransferase 2 family protein
MQNKKKIWKALRWLLVILIVAGTAWFFYREFSVNWSSLSEAGIQYDLLLLCIAFLLICGGYFVNTRAWQLLINHYATGRRMTFSESVAIVNTSQLTKYLPGKVWSVALQVWWMGERGFSRPLVFFVNLIAIFSSLLATSLAGLVLFAVTNEHMSSSLSLLILICGITAYGLFVVFHAPTIRLCVRLVNKIFKKDIGVFSMAFRRILEAQLLYLAGAALFAAGMYFVCLGLGMANNPYVIFTILGAILISDVIGFIVLVAPGGIGVREGVMYVILEKVSVVSFALVIPIATRIITMLADLVIGMAGLILLKKFLKKKA